MRDILHLCHRLDDKALVKIPDGIRLRNYAGPADTRVWLELRQRAFAGARVNVRPWDEPDFEQEFLAKLWWRPEHLWFAEARASNGTWAPVGTVTLALRGAGDDARPVVHWLAVLPAWRRQHVGRLLICVLEARAWELGYRAVWLETHAAWEEAVRLYRALGYESAIGASSSSDAS